MKEEKQGSKLKKILILLLIVLVSIVSFAGIYVKDGNKMINRIPDYIIGTDLEGFRVLKIKVDDSKKDVIKDADGNVIDSATDEEIEEKGYTKEEEPINSEESLNEDNYLSAKKIISNRLKDLGVSDYRIKQDLDDGSIIVELKENSNTDDIISNLTTVGKFEIRDSETKEVLLSNDDIKTAQVLYNSTSTGTTIYLSIEFDKEGTKKLEEISNTYVEVTDTEESSDSSSGESATEAETTETDATEEGNTEDANASDSESTGNESENSEEAKKEKKIDIVLDDDTLISTAFSTPIANGKLQLSVGNSSSTGSTESTDSDTLNKYVKQAKNMATLLKNNKLPLKYTSETNKYIKTPINMDVVKIVLIVFGAVLALMLLVLIVKFKAKGLLAVISHIGLNAIVLLMIRYWNVEIELSGLIAIGLVQILNYMALWILLNGQKEQKINKSIFKFIYRIIPACIISIVFVFTNYQPIYSFGMVVFWGIAIIVLYNIIATKNLIDD